MNNYNVRIIKLNDDFPIIVLAIYQITLEEFERRLRAIGWDLSRKGSGGGKADYMAFSPDGKHKLTIMAHNWEKNWYDVKRKITQNRDLGFLFDSVFEIPKHFNFQTQRVEVPQKKYKNVTISVPQQLPKGLIGWQIRINNLWIEVAEIDWEKYEIMDKEGNIYSLPTKNIQIRKEIT